MLKNTYIIALSAVLLSVSITGQASDSLSQQAAQHHAAGQWAASIAAYQQLLQEEDALTVTAIEQANYRIAHGYIQLGQGQAALTANEHIANATQIPPFLVLYQKAQALQLLGERQTVIEALQATTKAGYSNVNELKTNPMWDAIRTDAAFVAVIQHADENLRPCHYDERHRQFDFWLGQWEVYGNPQRTGPLFGKNSITSTEQGCLIMEHWSGASGSSGTSMNYFDGIQGKWVQRWVSNGVSIDYAGGLITVEGGKQAMQLVGKIHYASERQQPQLRDFRGTWTPLKNGVVQQFFEESIDGGTTWYPWFNGYYFPMTENPNDE